jgi:transcriptional regulator with GAF, ATPase, and Fis domain
MKEPFIIGKSPTIREIREFIQRSALSDSNVLILGETGVGKELVARRIHYESPRKAEPFVKLNCTSINESLFESELFGHRKGAFTGALFDRPGLIESARAGTLFFDEIGDISPYIQAKLLSVVEDKETRRVGENNVRRVHARFIFATNKDLHSSIVNKTFRDDLYYRINILSIFIAPLRTRKEDVGPLIEAFQRSESSKGSTSIVITDKAIEKLAAYDFPGNIRELESLLKRAQALASSNLITEEHIVFCRWESPRHFRSRWTRYPITKIIQALIDCKGNKTAAAAQLGMSRVHLYRLLNSPQKTDSPGPFAK